MKQFIEETKKRYLKLKESEKELEAQERIYADKTLSLSVEFDKAYAASESLKRMFFRKDNELKRKKEKFITKKYRNHTIGILLSFIIPLVIVTLITDALIWKLACLFFGSIAGLVSAAILNKNEKTKYEDEFNSQEEIIKLKEEIEKLRKEYNIKEKELNEIRGRKNSHTKEVVELERKLKQVREAITLLQKNSFEELIGIEQIKQEEQKLKLN